MESPDAASLPKELISKVQRFHFRTRHMANEVFAGQYVSAFRGKGMEFLEVREYMDGDDVRDIDWKVTARFGRPFVKVFAEERELTVILVVDVSASNLFATVNRPKADVAAEVAGLLGFTAVRTNDKVGAVLFSGQVDRFIPPRKGPGHVWRMIREIFAKKPEGATDISAALDTLNRVVRRRAIVFLISDFIVPGPDQRFATALSLTARKHDLTVVRVSDPAETVLPEVGLAWFSDPETGLLTVADTGNRRLRARYAADAKKREIEFNQLFARNGVPVVDLSTRMESVVEPLAAYFRKREGRR
ncbi:MAG: DUF58 domain-containing protein [Deltaproteobacteria bacterium]|nr:DUF58 domain-containing protein [Deltaproteobacteria bacterium]